MRGVSKCFVMWQGRTAERLATHSLLRQAIMRGMNVRLASAYGVWYEWSARRRYIEAVGAKCVRRVWKLCLAKAMSAMWEHRSRCVKVRKALRRLRHRSTGAAFGSWWEATKAWQLERIRADTAAGLRAFQVEKLQAEQKIREQAEIRKERVAAASVRRMQMRGVSRSFATWFTMHGRARNVKVLLQRIARKMQNKTVSYTHLTLPTICSV